MTLKKDYDECRKELAHYKQRFTDLMQAYIRLTDEVRELRKAKLGL